MTEYPRGNFGEIRLAAHSSGLAPSIEEMAQMDRAAIATGLSAKVLMERAGGEIARKILERYPAAREISVFCGSGNNGGDGLVIAKVLIEAGRKVHVVLAAAQRYSDECLRQLEAHREILLFGTEGRPAIESSTIFRDLAADDVERLVERSDVIVDALLGTGQRSNPRRETATLVEIVRHRQSRGVPPVVIAVDIPTGVDGETGQMFTPHISADRTICVEHIKRGLVQFPARAACGAIETVSIGIGSEVETEFQILEHQNLPALGPRKPDSHKGDFGRILVIGGSVGMPGAPLLTALGALRAGAGIVSRVVKRGWASSPELPECMLSMLSHDGDHFEGQDATEVVDLLGGFDVVVIGPGMGVAKDTHEFLRRVCDGVRLLGKRTVIDADAINIVAQAGISLDGIDAVITPHPGEASRMLGRPTPSLQGDRFTAVRELWEKYRVVSVLKGAGTLVYGASGGRIVCRGTPYLATAGSGDVLAGIIAACCARLEVAFDAACLGVWLHAVAGILASERSGGPVLASDIAYATSAVIGNLER